MKTQQRKKDNPDKMSEEFFDFHKRKRLPILLVFFTLAAAVSTVNTASGEEGKKSKATTAYDSNGKRDPFVPLVRDGRIISSSPSSTQNIDATSLTLVGILWDADGKSVALINDFEARAGDMIGNYEVKEITKDSVRLSKEGGEDIVLKISFEETGSPVADESQKKTGIKRR